MKFKKSVSQYVKFWTAYGFMSPLVFAVGFITCWWLDWLNLENWMRVSGVVLACTAVVWWWWTMMTINKLNSTLTKNVDHFLELLNIVKELNHDVKETNTNYRKRSKPKSSQSKTTKK